MEKARTFKDLRVWQRAHNLVLQIYKNTANFPGVERFGLVSQMRRAAVSIPANISEGFSKASTNGKLHFYNVAQCSLEEVKYYIVLSRDLKYLKEDEAFCSLVEEVGIMLSKYIDRIKGTG